MQSRQVARSAAPARAPAQAAPAASVAPAAGVDTAGADAGLDTPILDAAGLGADQGQAASDPNAPIVERAGTRGGPLSKERGVEVL
jgi:hypothetical protein